MWWLNWIKDIPNSVSLIIPWDSEYSGPSQIITWVSLVHFLQDNPLDWEDWDVSLFEETLPEEKHLIDALIMEIVDNMINIWHLLSEPFVTQKYTFCLERYSLMTNVWSFQSWKLNIVNNKTQDSFVLRDVPFCPVTMRIEEVDPNLQTYQITEFYPWFKIWKWDKIDVYFNWGLVANIVTWEFNLAEDFVWEIDEDVIFSKLVDVLEILKDLLYDKIDLIEGITQPKLITILQMKKWIKSF